MCETQLRPINVSCWPLASSPPPSCLTFLICKESYTVYVYRVLRNNSPVHSVTVTWSCDTLVLTASSSSSSATLPPFFFLPWESVSWTFLGCHYASFLTRSLVVSNSPLSVFGHLSRCPASHLAITRTIWYEWIRSGQYPLACCKMPFECLFRKFMYIIYCALLYIFTFRLISFFSLFSQSIQLKCLFQLPFSFNSIVQSLFLSLSNYCSVFWSWKWIPDILMPLSNIICWVNKNLTSTRLPNFCLCIGLSKAYCHHRH